MKGEPKFKVDEFVLFGKKKTQIEYVHGDGNYTVRVPGTNDWSVVAESELTKEKEARK